MVHREENDEPRVGLPPLPGTYLLVPRFSKRLENVVGKLGVLRVQSGFYLYVGSALGLGGLVARVGRHCRREKTLRWHVDYLRAEAQIEAVWYTAGKSHRECRWASALSRLPGASVPPTGFGASDCGCESHLFFFTLPPSVADFRKNLRNQRIESRRIADFKGAKNAVAASVRWPASDPAVRLPGQPCHRGRWHRA
jgi:Uri superfamily endonuclease